MDKGLVDVFFIDTVTTEIYTLSLHDALPISRDGGARAARPRVGGNRAARVSHRQRPRRRHREGERSEEHTSELQSRRDLVCRLLLEKKKERDRVLRGNGHRRDRPVYRVRDTQ